MATRSRTSFQKRQKEILRLERQREKAAKRLQRKNAPKEDGNVEAADPDESVAEPEETAEGESGVAE